MASPLAALHPPTAPDRPLIPPASRQPPHDY